MSIVRTSALFSLFAQICFSGLTAAGLFVDLPTEDADDLQIIFGVEFASQAVEIIWYSIVILRDKEITTWTRYIDWVVSTPFMLVSLLMFFFLRRGVPVMDVLTYGPTYAVLSLNMLMLASGFALELETMPKLFSLGLGSAALVGVYTMIAREIDDGDDWSVGLFWGTYAVWGLYGVAAALPYVPKNVMYNFIDVVSKNCFGLFLFVYAVTTAV